MKVLAVPAAEEGKADKQEGAAVPAVWAVAAEAAALAVGACCTYASFLHDISVQVQKQNLTCR